MNNSTELTATVAALSPDGSGVIKLDGKVYFVPLAIPGQTVRFRPRKRKKKAYFGELIEVIEQSEHYVPPPDPQFPQHGGAPWQHLDYHQQLIWKQRFVTDALERIGKIVDPPVRDIIGSPLTERYRNKMEFSFGYAEMRLEITDDGTKIWHDEGAGLGLHRRGSWKQIVSITDTVIAPQKTLKIRELIEIFALQSGLAVWNAQTKQGFWRHVTVRESARTGEVLVNIVVSEEKPAAFWQDLVFQLRQNVLGITGILMTVYDGVSVPGDELEPVVLFGKTYYSESFCGLDVKISHNAFFQVNTLSAEKLIHSISSLIGLEGGEHLLDLFCGTGTIGLALSKSSDCFVSGIEIVSKAVADARANAERNQIDNAMFYAGAVEHLLPDLLARVHFDAVIVDPPRAGLHKKARKAFADIPAEKLIVVSCNPATFARDLQEITESGWRLEAVQPHDLFPHTPHVECVALLMKNI